MVEYEVEQDTWSKEFPNFGASKQLSVLGWIPSLTTSCKYYLVQCSVCSQDTELFGEALYKITKGNLLKGRMPCGCSKRTKWSREQFAVLCSRKAKELGHTFIDFTGEWKGQDTKIKMLCEKHGEWSSGVINSLINNNTSCPGCKSDITAKRSVKPDEVMIQSFFASGAFHPDTKFWRSERKTKSGTKRYWNVYCPDCKEQGESQDSNLQVGNRPCACSPQRQQQCYINILNDNGTTVAIKFGIANNSLLRLKQQEALSIFSMEQYAVYKFDSIASCKKAERECKQELQCGIVSKADMRDGSSETTAASNLQAIIDIYKRNGGVETALHNTTIAKVAVNMKGNKDEMCSV